MTAVFPPPGFVLQESALPGIEVYAPAPETPQESGPEVVEFKCPQCQATTAYSVADGGLRCAHCGYYEPPAREVVGKDAQEFEFTVETMAAAAHGWGESRRELQCQNCMARTTLPEGELSHTCPFCGSNRVIQQTAAQDALRPRFIIPFKVEETACREIARTWLGSSWMTPRALRDVTRIAHFNGIYLPYWTFDARARADWRAEVGHTVSKRHYSGGKWVTRTHTVWRWESGHVDHFFDDWVVCGTTRLSQVLLGRIQKFDLQALTPYAAQFLAGFMAQAYDVPLDAAWTKGRDEMREETRELCRKQASTSKIRSFTMSLDFADESWRYVLLPVYVAVYSYEDKTYQVMINGQTGEITGQRPVDWTKVWLAVAALLAPGVLLGLVGIVTLLLGVGVVVGGVALVLLLIGGIISAIILGHASEMGNA